jgi:hypothetical protein
MASNTKKYIIWGSVSVLAIGGGILLYNWYKKRDDEHKGLLKDLLDKIKNQDEKPKDENQDNSNNNANSVPSSGNVTTQTVNPFKDKDELTEFQKWVIEVKKDSKILAPFGADGAWGGKSLDAVNKYYKEYIESKTKAPDPTPEPKPTISENLSKDIATIRAIATGDRTKESYLKSVAISNPDYVRNWAIAIRKRIQNPLYGTYFPFKNKIYESYSGTEVFNKYLIGKEGEPTSFYGEAPFLRTEPNQRSSKLATSSGFNLGEIKELFYNNEDKKLFAYVPENKRSGSYKWIYAGFIKLI